MCFLLNNGGLVSKSSIFLYYNQYFGIKIADHIGLFGFAIPELIFSPQLYRQVDTIMESRVFIKVCFTVDFRNGVSGPKSFATHTESSNGTHNFLCTSNSFTSVI